MVAARESSCVPSKRVRSRRPNCSAPSRFIDSRVRDLEGCIEAIRADLDRLIDTARRTRPDKENLFASLEYDRAAWERVQQGIDRWAKR